MVCSNPSLISKPRHRRSSCDGAPTGCSRAEFPAGPRTKANVLAAYRATGDGGARVRTIMRKCPNLRDAVNVAASSTYDGKKHRHQSRLKPKFLKQFAIEIEAELATSSRVKSFDELFEMVQKAANRVWGIGEMATYDVTDRIAAYLNLKPEYVYLHAGTREGAAKLIDVRGKKKVKPTDFPAPFNHMAARAIEDVLCIFKEDL